MVPAFGIRTLSAGDGDGRDIAVDVQRIAFLGIGSGNLRSNYFSDETIAERMNVPEDSIHEVFNGVFFEYLNHASLKGGKADVVYCCLGEGKAILESVKYDNRGDEMESDLSAVPQGELSDFLQKTSTDYLVLVDQYYIKREGYPYHNISHIINYSVYDGKKKVVCRGRHRFSSLDMDDLGSYSRQFSKIASKLLAKIN
jgi:hypothetical protein